MAIEIPADLEDALKDRASAAGFSGLEQYLLHLVHQDQEVRRWAIDDGRMPQGGSILCIRTRKCAAGKNLRLRILESSPWRSKGWRAVPRCRST